MSITRTIPQHFTAGDSIEWRETIEGHNASDGWAIIYAFVFNGKLVTSIESTPDGDTHILTLEPTKSALFSAGTHKFQAYAKREDERKTILNGVVNVAADYLTSEDTRTDAEKTLARLWDTYNKLAAKSLSTKSSGGTSTTDKTMDEVMAQIEKLTAFIAKEKARARASMTGIKRSSTIKAWFQ